MRTAGLDGSSKTWPTLRAEWVFASRPPQALSRLSPAEPIRKSGVVRHERSKPVSPRDLDFNHLAAGGDGGCRYADLRPPQLAASFIQPDRCSKAFFGGPRGVPIRHISRFGTGRI